MRKLQFAALLLALLLPLLGHATVLGFGPDCGGCSTQQVSPGCGGFNWDSNSYEVGNSYYMGNYNNSYGAPSGAGMYNAFGVAQVTMTSNTPFYFNGADFTAWSENDQYQSFSSTSVTIFAYDSSNNLLGTFSSGLPSDSYTFVTAGVDNVSKLVFQNDCNCSGEWWVMDNFTYNENNGGVPEPASLFLLGSGLLGIGGTVRKRIKK